LIDLNHNYRNSQPFTSTRPTVPNETTRTGRLLSVISSIGGFLFGYDMGFMSGAIPLINKDIHLTDTDQVGG
jgi:hypothetical protein